MARLFDGNSKGGQPADSDVDILANSERASMFTMTELSGLVQRNRLCKKWDWQWRICPGVMVRACSLGLAGKEIIWCTAQSQFFHKLRTRKEIRETSNTMRFQKKHHAITHDYQSISIALWLLHSSEYSANIREAMVEKLA